MNEYERETRRMEREDKLQALRDSLPWRYWLLRWLDIWGWPLVFGTLLFATIAIPLLWWVLN